MKPIKPQTKQKVVLFANLLIYSSNILHVFLSILFLLQAAELNFDEALNPNNPYRENKNLVIKQYHLWNSKDMNKIELPPINLHKEPIQECHNPSELHGYMMRLLPSYYGQQSDRKSVV